MKQGWAVKKLGELCELYQPKTISSKDMCEDGQYPVFGANGIIGKYDKYNHEEPQLLITCRGATCGSVNISEPQSWINGNAMVVRPIDDSLHIKFVEYLFRGGIDISKTITGAAQPQITRQSLSPILISFPQSFPEQQRIVAILDEAFEAIAKAKTNAEQNLKNAKELFESYLQSVFENRGEGWEEKTLSQLSKKKDAIVSGPFGSNLKVSDYQNEGIPILRLQNIGKGYFIDKSIKYITPEKADELKYHSFVSGDIALAKLGIPIGKTCTIPNHFKSGIITADIVRIRPDLSIVNYKFLEYFLNTNMSISQLTGNISGATRPRVNLSDVRNIKLHLPTLSEQEVIVQKLDILSIETKRLEAIYQKKTEDLEELKKSILQKAFNGEL